MWYFKSGTQETSCLDKNFQKLQFYCIDMGFFNHYVKLKLNFGYVE